MPACVRVRGVCARVRMCASVCAGLSTRACVCVRVCVRARGPGATPTFKLFTPVQIQVFNTLREVLDVSWEREHCQQQFGDQ